MRRAVAIGMVAVLTATALGSQTGYAQRNISKKDMDDFQASMQGGPNHNYGGAIAQQRIPDIPKEQLDKRYEKLLSAVKKPDLTLAEIKRNLVAIEAEKDKVRAKTGKILESGRFMTIGGELTAVPDKSDILNVKLLRLLADVLSPYKYLASLGDEQLKTAEPAIAREAAAMQLLIYHSKGSPQEQARGAKQQAHILRDRLNLLPKPPEPRDGPKKTQLTALQSLEIRELTAKMEALELVADVVIKHAKDQ